MLMGFRVSSVPFLVVAAEEVTVASSVEVRADVKEPLDQGGILRHAAHVEHILPIVLLEVTLNSNINCSPPTGKCRGGAWGTT